VRRDNPAASPPQLKCVRKGADEVIIHYGSRRRMCGVAKGIVRGLARHYGEKVTLAEPTCMLKGGAACQIVVKRSR
jgi:hypothetical protein